MKAKLLLKKMIALVLYRSGFVFKKIEECKRKQGFLLLMYHRINLPSDTIQAGMYVEPDTFKMHIDFLAKHFRIISMFDLVKLFEKKDRIGKNDKPICSITFDDGWKDFYDYGYPVLKSKNVPATVFLPTDFIGTTKQFWTDQLAEIILKSDIKSNVKSMNNEVLDVIVKISNLKGYYEERLEKSIAILKNKKYSFIKKAIEEMAKIYQVDIENRDRSFLSWNEVSQLYKSGLISFGSHTHTHQIMTTLNEREIEEELKVSKDKLNKLNIINQSFMPFCYPNGNYSDSIIRLVEGAGYDLAVTTKNGWNTTNTNRFRLKRIGIHQDMTSTLPLFFCKIASLL